MGFHHCDRKLESIFVGVLGMAFPNAWFRDVESELAGVLTMDLVEKPEKSVTIKHGHVQDAWYGLNEMHFLL